MRRSNNEDFLPVPRKRERDLSRRAEDDWLSPWGFAGASPWQMMRRMQEDMDRVFDRFLSGSFGDLGAATQALQQWSPSMDISEDAGGWRVEVDLPGVRQEDIDIQIQDRRLLLRAEMRQEEAPEQSEQERQYHRRERRFGYFERVLPLPQNADEDNIRCEFRDGVLTCYIPRREQVAPQVRRIPIGGDAEPAAIAPSASAPSASAPSENGHENNGHAGNGADSGGGGKTARKPRRKAAVSES